MLGQTSTGSVAVSLQVGTAALISDLNDFSLSAWAPGDPDVAAADSVCVYTNSPTAKYVVTPSSMNAGLSGRFRVSDHAGSYVPYQIGWSDSGGSRFANSTCGGLNLPCPGNGLPSVSQANANLVSPNCSGGTNATLSLYIPATDLNSSVDRKSTRLNSSHSDRSRMPSSA